MTNFHQPMPSFQRSNQPMSSSQQQPQQTMSPFSSYSLTIPNTQQTQRFPQQFLQNQPMYFPQVGRQAVQLNPGNYSVSLSMFFTKNYYPNILDSLKNYSFTI